MLVEVVRFDRSQAIAVTLLRQPDIGYANVLYFFTSAFIWLSGIFFLADLYTAEHKVQIWLKPTICIYLAAVVGFAVLQGVANLPTPLAIGPTQRALNSPFEDIHSLGAVAVSIFVGLLASIDVRPTKSLLYKLTALGLMGLVVISCWSRSTWLAAILCVGLIAYLRFPRKWFWGLVLVAGSVVAGGNIASNTEVWNHNRFLWRFGTLIKIENPSAKDPSRVALYHKAIDMIRERPLTGHGIGSFFRKSPRYARPGDPEGAQPEFAHNFLLQFAVELGLPAAMLLVTTVGATLYRGLRLSGLAHQSTSQELAVFGLTMALIAYILTQMTANALNIYPSNQFFFWLIIVGILTWPDPCSGRAIAPGLANGVRCE